MLCEICFPMLQNVFTEEPNFDYREHHPTLISLLDAANAGCDICEPLMQYLLKTEQRENRRLQGFQYLLKEHGTSVVVTIFAHFEIDGITRYHWQSRSLLVTPMSGFALGDGVDVESRDASISEAEAVLRIREWLGNCLSDHGSQCLKGGTKTSSYPSRIRKWMSSFISNHESERQVGGGHSSSYPSRLLDLREDSSFRVIRTALERPTGPYVSLSYCWGPNPTFLRLTAWNMAELEAGTPVSELPLAFRQVISILRQLGLRYLWIDSLCIIQAGPGSIEDWQVESARMHQVYSDSILTLSLACATNPNESILNRSCRQKTWTSPFQIKPDTSDEDSTEALVVLGVDYFSDGLYDLPLSHRGWTLQERVMATRNVSFGLGELFWDCSQLPNASQSVPRGLQGTQVGTDNLPRFRLAESIPYGSDYATLLKTWWSLLDEYTKRRLTYPEHDKLVALSAVALELGKAMDDVYIAGHFWKTLPSSLNWILPERNSAYTISQKGRADTTWPIVTSKENDNGKTHHTPSWSWASMDGPIFPWKYSWTDLTDRCHPLAEAVSYTCKLANEENPTGPCLFASLSIKAFCTEVQWSCETTQSIAACSELCTGRLALNHLDFDDREVQKPEGSKYVFAALTMDLPFWSGLVLEDATQEGEQRYRRVGHFGITTPLDLDSPEWKEHMRLFGWDRKLITLI